MGIGSQDSADFSGVCSAGYSPLPARGEVDPADVLLDAKDYGEGINRSRILRPAGMNDTAVPSSPVRAIADSGLASIAVMSPDLVPMTIRMMGNVVYWHAPTGKVLMEIGNLSSSELKTTLDLGAIKPIGDETRGSASHNVNLINHDDDHPIHTVDDVSIIRIPEARVVDHKDNSEVMTRGGRRGYKQLVRNQRVKIEPEHNYSPGEVAAALNLSYDSALRRMQKMKGVVDLGTKTRRYKRGKRKLRISGRNLLAYLRTKTVV